MTAADIPSTVDDLTVRYYASSIRCQGGRHHAEGLNGQDHTAVSRCPQGIVLAVADGVSLITDECGVPVHSRCEVGSWIVAEVAAAAGRKALLDGWDSEDVVDQVAEALVSTLKPIWESLGEKRARHGLATTLLLAVITEECTRIWASGDGYWGILLPESADLETLKGEALIDTVRQGVRSVAGSQHCARLGKLAAYEARHDATRTAAQLRPVLTYWGPIIGAHIATDGLRDEPEVLAMARQTALRSKPAIEVALRRDARSDDLGLAWVASRFPWMEESP